MPAGFFSNITEEAKARLEERKHRALSSPEELKAFFKACDRREKGREPDPNHFDGDVELFPLGATDWETLPVSAGYVDSGRGFGIADLAEKRRTRFVGYEALESPACRVVVEPLTLLDWPALMPYVRALLNPCFRGKCAPSCESMNTPIWMA